MKKIYILILSASTLIANNAFADKYHKYHNNCEKCRNERNSQADYNRAKQQRNIEQNRQQNFQNQNWQQRQNSEPYYENRYEYNYQYEYNTNHNTHQQSQNHSYSNFENNEQTFDNANTLEQYIEIKAAFSQSKNKIKSNLISVAMPGGINIFESNFNLNKSVPGASLAYGLSFKLPANLGHFRTELEGNYRADTKKSIHYNPQTEKIKISNNSMFLNMYYDIPTGSIITPYIGGGVGLSKLKFDSEISDQSSPDFKISKTNFSYNLAAGFSIKVSQNSKINLGYRYVNYGDLEKTIIASIPSLHNTYKVKAETSAHEALLGFRYSF